MRAQDIITNADILAERQARFDATPGPRVGDFLLLPQLDPRAQAYTRFTHAWDDGLQVGGHEEGSYHINPRGFISYSGGLDPRIPLGDIIPTGEMRDGSVWFFDRGLPCGGRGIYTKILFREFRLREGADTSRIFAMGTQHHLVFHQGCYCVTRRAMSLTAFNTEEELWTWLARENYFIAKPAVESQTILWGSQNPEIKTHELNN